MYVVYLHGTFYLSYCILYLESRNMVFKNTKFQISTSTSFKCRFYLYFILNHIAVLVNYKGTRDRYSLLRSIISIGITRQSVAYKALSARLFAFLLLVCETHFREYGKGITSEKYQTINGRQERIERDVHATTDMYVRLQSGEMVKHEDMESKYRGSA